MLDDFDQIVDESSMSPELKARLEALKKSLEEQMLPCPSPPSLGGVDEGSAGSAGSASAGTTDLLNTFEAAVDAAGVGGEAGDALDSLLAKLKEDAIPCKSPPPPPAIYPPPPPKCMPRSMAATMDNLKGVMEKASDAGEKTHVGEMLMYMRASYPEGIEPCPAPPPAPPPPCSPDDAGDEPCVEEAVKDAVNKALSDMGLPTPRPTPITQQSVDAAMDKFEDAAAIIKNMDPDLYEDVQKAMAVIKENAASGTCPTCQSAMHGSARTADERRQSSGSAAGGVSCSHSSTGASGGHGVGVCRAL